MPDYKEPTGPVAGDDEAWLGEGEWGALTPQDREVDAADHGLRLDRFLARHWPEFSRNHLQALIEQGDVQVMGQPLTLAARKVRVGQRVQVLLRPTAQSLAFTPEAMDLHILHEDAALMVLFKPAGRVVHPAAGHWRGTLLNGLLAHDPAAAQLPRAGIVHRLDKDTSGLMVVARTLPAHTALVRDLAARRVQRDYLAIVQGAHLPGPRVRIDAPVGRDPVSRVRMAVVHGGKPACTDVWPLLDSAPYTPVHCQLHTGRTHQIRVHLAHRGWPLLGDVLYGGRRELGLMRQALHAFRLRLNHPLTGEPLAFEAPMPSDMAQAWAVLGAPPVEQLPVRERAPWTAPG